MADGGDKEVFDTVLSLGLGGGGGGSSSVGDINSGGGSKKNEAYHSDNGGEGTRKKLKLTADQLNVLEHTFNRQKTIDQAQKDELARRLNLATRQVEIWFQNRRARQKQQETGKEYDTLKEKYENKIAENIQLNQRLQLALALTGAPGGATPVIAILQALQICPFASIKYNNSSSDQNNPNNGSD